MKDAHSPALEASLLLRPRGAASLWRWRRPSEEEERVEGRVDGKLGDARVVIGAPALAQHLFDRGDCLIAATSEPELVAGREAEATGCLEAERGVAGAEAPAAAVIELRIVGRTLVGKSYPSSLTFFFLCRPASSFTSF